MYLKRVSTERLDKIDLQFEDNAAVCVVLASVTDTLLSYEKGFEIKGLRYTLRIKMDIMYSMQEQSLMTDGKIS